VALVGTDVPWLSQAIVAEGFAALDRDDVALGPARDGGYYLVALRQPHPGLFEDIAWSTAKVLPATLARAERLGLRVRLLPLLTDLDTIDDLRAEWPRVQPLLEGDPELARAVAAAVGLAAQEGTT
jgi:glycosyltransferase A (GT-A) superfamily protein (DUF2064 family)